MSVQKMEANGCVDMKFIIFLKATLGKMVATKTLSNDFINLQFWQNWPHKFYNIKSYDATKDEFEMDNKKADDTGFDSSEEEDDQQEEDDDREESQSIVRKCFF